MECLPGDVDRFGGVSVELQGFRELADEFAWLLERSVREWKRQGLRVAWLKIPRDGSHLIPDALAVGFDFHHCEPAYVMLTRRLAVRGDFPSCASHYVGAGGVVTSDGGELLVVLEAHEALERPKAFKLPGGLVEVGERIEDGVMREVLEETGVHTRFEGLVGLGHVSSWFQHKPSLYFVCRLTPLSRRIEVDEVEIAEALWMPVEEFLASEHVASFNKEVVQVALSREVSLVPSILEHGSDGLELLLPPQATRG